VPAGWAAPALHYLARTLAGLALFGLPCGGVLVQVVTARRSPDGPSSSHPARLAWIAPFALVCAQVVPFTVHTAGFADWTAEIEQVVVSGSGTIPIAGSVACQCQCPCPCLWARRGPACRASYWAVQPPSTGSTVPVTSPAAGEAR